MSAPKCKEEQTLPFCGPLLPKVYYYLIYIRSTVCDLTWFFCEKKSKRKNRNIALLFQIWQENNTKDFQLTQPIPSSQFLYLTFSTHTVSECPDYYVLHFISN